MTELVNQVEMTVGIVKAYVSANSVPQTELPNLLNSVFQAVISLGSEVEAPPKQAPAVPIGKSVTPDYLVCLDDGRKLKSLKRHLRVLGMTPEQYREKWGLHRDYPMVSANYSAYRAQVAKDIGLGYRS